MSGAHGATAPQAGVGVTGARAAACVKAAQEKEEKQWELILANKTWVNDFSDQYYEKQFDASRRALDSILIELPAGRYQGVDQPAVKLRLAELVTIDDIFCGGRPTGLLKVKFDWEVLSAELRGHIDLVLPALRTPFHVAFGSFRKEGIIERVWFVRSSIANEDSVGDYHVTPLHLFIQSVSLLNVNADVDVVPVVMIETRATTSSLRDRVALAVLENSGDAFIGHMTRVGRSGCLKREEARDTIKVSFFNDQEVAYMENIALKRTPLDLVVSNVQDEDSLRMHEPMLEAIGELIGLGGRVVVGEGDVKPFFPVSQATYRVRMQISVRDYKHVLKAIDTIDKETSAGPLLLEVAGAEVETHISRRGITQISTRLMAYGWEVSRQGRGGGSGGGGGVSKSELTAAMEAQKRALDAMAESVKKEVSGLAEDVANVQAEVEGVASHLGDVTAEIGDVNSNVTRTRREAEEAFVGIAAMSVVNNRALGAIAEGRDLEESEILPPLVVRPRIAGGSLGGTPVREEAMNEAGLDEEGCQIAPGGVRRAAAAFEAGGGEGSGSAAEDDVPGTPVTPVRSALGSGMLADVVANAAAPREVDPALSGADDLEWCAAVGVSHESVGASEEKAELEEAIRAPLQCKLLAVQCCGLEAEVGEFWWWCAARLYHTA